MMEEASCIRGGGASGARGPAASSDQPDIGDADEVYLIFEGF
jgi:hypothetical protein